MRRSILLQLGATKRNETSAPRSGDFIVYNKTQVDPQQAAVTEVTKLVVFTDGSCMNNGRHNARAGYAVVWPNHQEFTKGYALQGEAQTNNRAEYSGCIEALRIADIIDPSKEQTLHIYTDSMLLINSITKWLQGWKSRNWVKADGHDVLNRDLLEIIDRYMKYRRIRWTHVRAHTGKANWESKWNDVADKLAREAALKN